MYREETVEEVDVEEECPMKKKICWAGLIMPQFWGIGNKLGIGLLAFIPVVFPFMAIYFAAKGYELAYEKIRYSGGKEHFRRNQIIWNIVAFVYIIAVVGIIYSFNADGLANYKKHKAELETLIEQTEAQRSRLAEEVEKLTSEEYLEPFTEGMEYTATEEVTFNDNTVLWHMKNSYEYEDLAEEEVRFEQPRVNYVSKEFTLADGRLLTITFSVDENFEIQEGDYSYFSDGEIHMISEGVYTSYDEMGVYMDKKEIDSILKAD